jgi:excisionase family DNA binding protein
MRNEDEHITAHPEDSDDFMSVSETAKLLFVSRPYVEKLLRQGNLKLHHMDESGSFVAKESILNYQAAQRPAMNEYQVLAGRQGKTSNVHPGTIAAAFELTQQASLGSPDRKPRRKFRPNSSRDVNA